MQFLLALGQNQGLLKSRLSKLRHLDSLFFYFLIIAILFFQIFQHNQLAQEIRNKTNFELFEELLQQRISHLERQIDDVRSLLSEQSSKLTQKIQENKKLVLLLTWELGLPIEHQAKLKQAQSALQDQKDLKYKFELVEVKRDAEQEQMADSDEDMDEEVSQSDSEIFQKELVRIENESSQCNYIDYMKQGFDKRSNIYSQNHEDIYRSNQINKSPFNNQFSLRDETIAEMEKAASYFGKICLVTIITVIILFLIFSKKQKSKASKSFLRNAFGKLYTERKKGMMKEEKDFLQF